MKNNSTLAIIAIAAVTALLVATTAISSLTDQAFATKKSFQQSASQFCLNQNARCQDLLNQIQGHDNTATVFGNQP